MPNMPLGNTDDFHNADGHNQQVIAAQVDNGTRHKQGEQRRHGPRYRHEPEYGNVIQRIENGRGIGAHAEKGGMAHMKNAGLPQDGIQRKRQQGIKTDADTHVQPVGIAEKRKDADRGSQQQAGKQAASPVTRKSGGGNHSLSAVLSPRIPVGRMMRMRISTQNATASFQAKAM